MNEERKQGGLKIKFSKQRRKKKKKKKRAISNKLQLCLKFKTMCQIHNFYSSLKK